MKKKRKNIRKKLEGWALFMQEDSRMFKNRKK